ncbi:hypothetical protein ABK040_010953 [Willaertia magna]
MEITNIAVFFSDHGLGHLTRTAPIINSLYNLYPKATFHIITAVNPFFIKERLQEIPENQIRLLNIKISTGVSEEENSVNTCPIKTIERWQLHYKQHFEPYIGKEIKPFIDDLIIRTKTKEEEEEKLNSMVFKIEAFLKPFFIQLVVFDVPEIAPLIAKRLNEEYNKKNLNHNEVKNEKKEMNWPISVGVSNWLWEWIYDHCMDHITKDQMNDKNTIIGKLNNKDITMNELIKEKELMVFQSRSLYTIFGKTDLFIRLPCYTNDFPYNKDVYSNIDINKENNYTTLKSLGNHWPITETIKKAKFTKEEMKNYIVRKCKLSENTTIDISKMKIMMYSFGGLSFPSSNLIKQHEPNWNIPEDWILIVMCATTSNNTEEEHFCPPNVVNLTFTDLGNDSIDFARDLLLGIDVMVGKTSYGTVTECLYHQIPTLYMERRGMIEHPLTEKGLIENLGKECCCLVEGEEVINATTSLFDKANNVLKAIKVRSKESIRSDLEFDGGRIGASLIQEYLLN